jgi:hypothetical protein
MFRALLAHLQETLHERRFGDYRMRLLMWGGLRVWEACSLPTASHQTTSTTAHNSHQICVCVVPPEDGQVMPETCRDFAT